jgi:hypothetical protein
MNDNSAESTKPPQNNVEEIINDGSDDVAPSSSFSANEPIHQDITVAADNNGVKCGMKNRFIALGGVLLIAPISTVAIMLPKKNEPNEKYIQVGQQKKPLTVPLPPFAPYQPF